MFFVLRFPPPPTYHLSRWAAAHKPFTGRPTSTIKVGFPLKTNWQAYLCPDVGLGPRVHRLWRGAAILPLACCYVKCVVGSVQEVLDFGFVWSFSGIWNFSPLFLPLPVGLHHPTQKGTFVLKEKHFVRKKVTYCLEEQSVQRRKYFTVLVRHDTFLIKDLVTLTCTCDRSLSLNWTSTCRAPSSLNSFKASRALSSRSLCATKPVNSR